MKIGDLVRINDLNEPDPRRSIGTIIKYDVYDRQFDGMSEQIVEVLWNAGHLGWILSSRLSKVENNLELRDVAMDI
jgi:hypothetical protein